MIKKAIPALLTVIVVMAPAQVSEELAKAKNCMTCHSIERKIVGPSYKEIAAITHLTMGNVGFLLHTALATLRRELTRPSAV